MSKQFNLLKCYVLLTISIFFIAGCNNQNDTATPAPADTTAAHATTAPAPASLTSGFLDTLYVDSLAFTNLKNDLTVFSYYIGSSGKLTLNGWRGKGLCNTNYNTVPDINLNNGGTSTVSYGQGTYLGNVLLTKDGVKKIIKTLKDNANAQYVLFVPQPRTDEFINYKILITDSDPSIKKIKPLVGIDPEVDTNPSPPKY